MALATGFAAAAANTDAHNSGGCAGIAAAAPYWREQSLDDCALMATADVIGQLTGREVSEQEIIAVAQNLPSRAHAGPIYLLPSDMSDPNQTGYGTNRRTFRCCWRNTASAGW